jgi:DNA-binding NarL/FixJ family response regulator
MEYRESVSSRNLSGASGLFSRNYPLSYNANNAREAPNIKANDGIDSLLARLHVAGVQLTRFACAGRGHVTISSPHQTFLVIEPVETLGRHFVSVLSTYGYAVVARDASDAIHHLSANHPWRGICIDGDLADCSLFAVIGDLVSSGSSRALTLIFSATLNELLVNQAYDIGAFYTTRPISKARLELFASRAILNGTRLTSQPSLPEMHAFCMRHGLTGCESALVLAALTGTTRKEYALRRRISLNTYKAQARSALQKIGVASMGDLRERFWLLLTPQG